VKAWTEMTDAEKDAAIAAGHAVPLLPPRARAATVGCIVATRIESDNVALGTVHPGGLVHAGHCVIQRGDVADVIAALTQIEGPPPLPELPESPVSAARADLEQALSASLSVPPGSTLVQLAQLAAQVLRAHAQRPPPVAGGDFEQLQHLLSRGAFEVPPRAAHDETNRAASGRFSGEVYDGVATADRIRADADRLRRDIGDLAIALRDVPPGGASGDAPGWLVRLHRAACEVAGIEVRESAPESDPSRIAAAPEPIRDWSGLPDVPPNVVPEPIAAPCAKCGAPLEGGPDSGVPCPAQGGGWMQQRAHLRCLTEQEIAKAADQLQRAVQLDAAVRAVLIGQGIAQRARLDDGALEYLVSALVRRLERPELFAASEPASRQGHAAAIAEARRVLAGVGDAIGRQEIGVLERALDGYERAVAAPPDLERALSPRCTRCWSRRYYHDRQLADGLCSPCRRRATGTQTLADRARDAGIDPAIVLEILRSPEGRAAIADCMAPQHVVEVVDERPAAGGQSAAEPEPGGFDDRPLETPHAFEPGNPEIWGMKCRRCGMTAAAERHRDAQRGETGHAPGQAGAAPLPVDQPTADPPRPSHAECLRKFTEASFAARAASPDPAVNPWVTGTAEVLASIDRTLAEPPRPGSPILRRVYRGDELATIPPGLYELTWGHGSGVTVLAAIGRYPTGVRWFAPVDWVSDVPCTRWDMVECVTEVRVPPDPRAAKGAP